MKEGQIMGQKFMIVKSIFVVFILTICVNISLSNDSFGIGYYGTHNSGHSGGHNSSFGYYGTHSNNFGRHGGRQSSNLHNNHNNRLHSSLYNNYGNRSYGSNSTNGYDNRYCRQNNYVQNNNYYISNENAAGTYEYANKEPYVFDYYGNEDSTDTDAYVFQYGENSGNLLACNDAN